MTGDRPETACLFSSVHLSPEDSDVGFLFSSELFPHPVCQIQGRMFRVFSCSRDAAHEDSTSDLCTLKARHPTLEASDCTLRHRFLVLSCGREENYLAERVVSRKERIEPVEQSLELPRHLVIIDRSGKDQNIGIQRLPADLIRIVADYTAKLLLADKTARQKFTVLPRREISSVSYPASCAPLAKAPASISELLFTLGLVDMISIFFMFSSSYFQASIIVTSPFPNSSVSSDADLSVILPSLVYAQEFEPKNTTI